jgi:NADH-quinone oxidoreductase subunit N
MFQAITLEISVLVLGFVLLGVESFSKAPSRKGLANAGLFALGWILLLSFFVQGNPTQVEPGSFWNFYSADLTALFFKRLAIVATIGVLILARDFEGTLKRFIPAERPGAGTGEFYCLPVLTCAGLMLMASATDLILAFVALELVTISFYVLVAYLRGQSESLEAGVKYLILGALSTGFFVYGMTWIYGITGDTNLAKVATKLATLQNSETAILFAFLLVLVGLGFKVGAVPFHIWIPDVYSGAPTPITAFLSVASKSAGFLLAVRVIQPFLGASPVAAKVALILTVVAGATLLVGNLGALPQNNLKRLLAYSSIGHAGYLLMALASSQTENSPSAFGSSASSVAFYLAGYLAMTLLAFLVLQTVASHSKGDDIAHFNGLAKRSPFLAFALTIAMASLAGIPLTAGFYGKFLVFTQAVKAQQFTLVGLGIVAVAAGFYFYLRVVAAAFWQEPNETTVIEISPLSRIAISVLIVGILVAGVFPKTILGMLTVS